MKAFLAGLGLMVALSAIAAIALTVHDWGLDAPQISDSGSVRAPENPANRDTSE